MSCGFEARRQVRSRRPEVVFVVGRCKGNVEWLADEDVQALKEGRSRYKGESNARQIDGDNTDESKEKKRNRRRKGKSQTRKASE